MKTSVRGNSRRGAHGGALAVALLACAALPAGLAAQTVTVQLQVADASTNGVLVSGFRWLVEEDNTNQPMPGNICDFESIGVDIHKSHAPVVASGHEPGATAMIELPAGRDFYISALPDAGYTLGGVTVAAGLAGSTQSATVLSNPFPVPTSQISVLVFHDNQPINNAPEVAALLEEGLEGFTVLIDDTVGQVWQDAFGNPLDTEYAFDPVTGQPMLDSNGAPIVTVMGDGVITTDATGQAFIKYIPPGKYGVQVVPPDGEGWIQTNTIEGTPTIDAWVKANEPPFFVEFGPAAWHVFFGFVREFSCLTGNPADAPGIDCPCLTDPNVAPGDPCPAAAQTGSVTGRLVFNHFARPPTLAGFFPGKPVEQAYVGLNDLFSRKGIYVSPADPPPAPEGTFTITDIPAGTYELVWWDANLDAIWGFATFTLPNPFPPPGGDPWNIVFGNVDPNTGQPDGNVLSFAWFGALEGSVFWDVNTNGFRDAGEAGLPFEDLALRFRDGTVYQATVTDVFGNYGFTEVFPFFKWLVAEVGFLRNVDTGYTAVVDNGGVIPDHDGWIMPSFGKLNPQRQFEDDGVTPRINPNTGNSLSRTEAHGSPGEFLLQAMHLFLGQMNYVDWGKYMYGPGESGGISGLVFYDVTRAENDPRYCFGEPWQPGVPRVQINVYDDWNADGIIDDLNGDGPTLADVDNYPLGFADGLSPGPEDVDWNTNGFFDPGDAIAMTWTDSWDDNVPTGCNHGDPTTTDPHNFGPGLPVICFQEVTECFDNYGTWNQIRPGVFDGGFAIASHFPGMEGGMQDPLNAEVDGLPPGIYIVEGVAPPEYETVKEEDRNVDFGEEYAPGTRAIPAACVGDDHLVPAEMTLFPGVPVDAAGTMTPLCDRKQVFHSGGQNSAVEFFMFTPVPKAARAVGFINNDLAAEFDPTSPVFGEKQAPQWLPIQFSDYAGNPLTRVYSDRYGAYNAMLPSTFTVNVPSPSGVSKNMISFRINDPGPIPDPDNPGQLMVDPWFDDNYSQTMFTFHFESGRTTYLDTPVIPVAAFAGNPDRNVDANPPDRTPVIYCVDGALGGPVVPGPGAAVTITSLGDTQVPNPEPPGPLGGDILVTRDYGFGLQGPDSSVTVGGVPLIINSWTNSTITATVPAGVTTGRLVVTRGDFGRLSSNLGVTLHVSAADYAGAVRLTGGGNWPATPIQDAIDAAAPGTLILIGPGSYNENPIMYKPIRLQGCGAGSAFINGTPLPVGRITEWHAKIQELIAAGDLIPFDAELFEPVEAPCVFVQHAPDSLIDGLTIWGGVSGGGIYVAGDSTGIEISNNRIKNNQGTYGGGIGVGDPGFDTLSLSVDIHHNEIVKNGGVQGAGGIAVFWGSHNYRITDNLIMGNFSRNVGAGIGHMGISNGGLIARNRIVFNEVFRGGAAGGEGAGIYIGSGRFNPAGAGLPGAPPAAPANGTGSVTIDANLIQGNLAGSSSGGGIRLLDVDAGNAVYPIHIYNNVIVNNVAAHRGGGIAIQDAQDVRIIHNTIANNDSTATSALSFPPGALTQSIPQAAGVAATNATGVLVSNIIRHNRSFYFDNTIPGIYGLPGGIAPRPGNPYWDIEDQAGVPVLDPEYCLLSETEAGGPWSATNIFPDPPTTDPLFDREYHNTLAVSAVIDEGGQARFVRYPEVSLTDGNYHLSGLHRSAAVAAGDPNAVSSAPELATDIDTDTRPLPPGQPDIGADQTLTMAAVQPVVLSAPSGLPDSSPAPPASETVIDGCSGSPIYVELWAQQVSAGPAPLRGPAGPRSSGMKADGAAALMAAATRSAGDVNLGTQLFPAAEPSGGMVAVEADGTDPALLALEGLAAVYAELAYDAAGLTCTSVLHDAPFIFAPGGDCTTPGLVSNLGGSNFTMPGLGVAPNWRRIATVVMSASLGAGYIIESGPDLAPVTVFGAGIVPPHLISWGVTPAFDVITCPYDLNMPPDCLITTADFLAMVPCLTASFPAGACEGDPAWAVLGCERMNFACQTLPGQPQCIDFNDLYGPYGLFTAAFFYGDVCGTGFPADPACGALAARDGGLRAGYEPSAELIDAFYDWQNGLIYAEQLYQMWEAEYLAYINPAPRPRPEISNVDVTPVVPLESATGAQVSPNEKASK